MIIYLFYFFYGEIKKIYASKVKNFKISYSYCSLPFCFNSKQDLSKKKVS